MQTVRTAAAKALAVIGVLAMADAPPARSQTPPGPIATGAEVLVETRFAVLAGKRVGLVTNQTGRIGAAHLADLMAKAANVRLTAILAPEHGFRGEAEAGARVGDALDAGTGVPVFSLYGATKKPTPQMLRNVDVLVFDIQDIGVRFYTYISTLGLAMQAAAEARIPFVVLDRPNPLGGDYVSGFVLEPALGSFVGRYPIPIVHGLTVGELARMIKGKRWLSGLHDLDLEVVAMRGWRRSMRWPELRRPWIATSPNIPTFEAALIYPGMGVVGEALVNEGRGTRMPFSVFGAPWLDGGRMVQHLEALKLAGVRFERSQFTPRSIPRVATHPRFEGKAISGVRIVVTDAGRFEPLEVGMHVLAGLASEARRQGKAQLIGNLSMFYAIAGTKRLRRMLADGRDGAAIIAAWQDEVARFKAHRAPYLLY